MKKLLQLLTLAVVCATGIFLFQGQDSPFSDYNNPNIDRPIMQPNFTANHNPPVKDVVVTDAFGYDNFNMGTAFAEVYNSINPTNPIGSFSAYNTNTGYWSTDGWTFTSNAPPFPNTAGDPWTAYDSLGNLYYITLNSSLTGTWVLKSANNGQTWGSAVAGCVGGDRETMACDQTGGPFANYIYCGETPGNFSRSINGGVSFTQTATMSNTLPGFMMAVGPGPTGTSGGAVYVVTSTGSFSAPTYTVYRSVDGGVTFSLMSTQNGWVNTVGTISNGRNSYENMRLRPYPFLYADNSYSANRGRFYIFFTANNPGGSGNKPDVYVRYSNDGGATFSAAVTINDDANSTVNAQFHPAGWVDKQTGKVYCQWMDTRNCPTADSSEIYASYSSNGGVTWQTNQNLSTAKFKINCATCGGGGTPRYQGDYTSIGSNRKVSLAAWTDFRAGSFGSYVAYFPDFALFARTPINVANGTNDSAFGFVSVPSVKLYADTVLFTSSITNPPGTGTLTLSFIDKTNNGIVRNLLVVPPMDSVRLRARTSGGVPNGVYNVVVTAKGPNGTPVHVRNVVVNVGPVGIGIIGNEVPNAFYLYQNYPNPFNPSTQIRFDIAKTGLVKLNVYDISGKLVANIVNSTLAAGKYSFDFDGANLSTGVYFYRIETPDYTSIRKMILVK